MADKDTKKLHIRGLTKTESQLSVFKESSNPAAPTYFYWNRSQKGTFLNIIPSVAANNGSNRKPLINVNGFPYRPARMVKLGDHYAILYYIWDVAEKKLKRRRVLKSELAAHTTYTQMVNYANEVIDEINSQLRDGGYQVTEQKSKKVKAYSFKDYTLLAAIDYVTNLKRDAEGLKPGSIREYTLFKSSLAKFMKVSDISPGIKMEDINSSFVNGYLHYLKEVEKLANKTHNNRLGIFSSVVNTLMRLDVDLYKKTGSPLRASIMLKPGPVRKHAAYTDKQMETLKKNILKDGKAHLWVYIQFIFYTLARPNELRHLKVGHIDMDRRQILIAGDHAKTNFEAHVGISDSFAKVINDSGVMDYAHDLFVFSNLLTVPGPRPVGSSYFYKQIKPYLQEFRKLNPNYDTYGFKHTGAISLYLATKDPYTVQRQCRHTTLSQTEKYLRDLGVFVGFENIKHWKGI